jgi:hypothetical protein
VSTRPRRLRILSLLASSGETGLSTRRLCEVCVEVTGLTGAGIMLLAGDVPGGSLCTTDDVSAQIGHLQYSLGEGPSVDAAQHGRPVLEPDLANPNEERWPAFSGEAVRAGVRAIFGFPLWVGAARLGALDLYRDRAGALTDDQFADMLVLADVVAAVVLAFQADAPPGRIAEELETGADFQYVVHQAAGMVAAQLDIGVVQAMTRLRAYAFGNDRRLTEVAMDVVERRLRFDSASGEKDSGS